MNRRCWSASMYNPLSRNGDKHVNFPWQCMLMKFNGAWPLASSESSPTLFDCLYLMWAFALIVLIALTCYVQAAFLLSAWGNILVVTECGCTVFMGIHNLLRLIHLSWQRKLMKRILRYFSENIWISKWVQLHSWSAFSIIDSKSIGKLKTLSQVHWPYAREHFLGWTLKFSFVSQN